MRFSYSKRDLKFDGFSIRFQYLGLPLSEEEQASFFAKWGDDIQSVISTGFQRIEKTLDRVLFLHEASDIEYKENVCSENFLKLLKKLWILQKK